MRVQKASVSVLALALLICHLAVVGGGRASADASVAHLSTWVSKSLPIPANDLAFEPLHNRLLVIVPAANSSVGNQLIELDSETGRIGRQVHVGSEPVSLAVTDDGEVAFIGMAGTNRIVKVDLNSFQVADSFSTGIAGGQGPRYPAEVEAVPGRNDRVVAALTYDNRSHHAGVWMFEDGVALPNHTPDQGGANRLEVASSTVAYGLDNSGSGGTISTFSLGPMGVTLVSSSSGTVPGFSDDMEYAMGRLYGTGGVMIDPVSRTPLGTYGNGVLEVTSPDEIVTVVNGTVVFRFDAKTGRPLDSRSFAELTPSVTAVVATRAGFAAGSGSGITLLGSGVGGVADTLPVPPTNVIDGFTITEIQLASSDMVFDEVRHRLYVSVPYGPSPFMNHVVAVDPASGAVVASLFVGSNPGPLALSEDRSRLHVGLRESGHIVTIDAEAFTWGRSFALGMQPGGTTPLVADDLEVRPGTNDTLAVALTANCCSSYEVAIYEGGVKLPQSTSWPTNPGRIEFADATTLYGTNISSSGFDFYRMAVGSTGVAVVQTTDYVLPGFNIDFKIVGGLLYASNGMVWEPRTPELLGTFTTARGAVAVDVGARRAYLAEGSALREFDLDTYRTVEQVPTGLSGARFLERTHVGLALAVGSGSSQRIALFTPVALVNAPYHPVQPVRVLDTRFGTGAPAARVGPAGTIDLVIAGAGGVPAAGVSAVVLNVTAVSATSSSFLTAWPAGSARPLAANLNYAGGQTISNLVTVKVGAEGGVSLYNHAGSVDIAADIAGWYGEAISPETAGGFTPVSPVRLYDSRAFNSRLGPLSRREVRVTGRFGLPLGGMSAIVFNLTAVEPTSASFLTVWPTDQPRPLAATLNTAPGQTISNLVVAKVNSSGNVTFDHLISIYNHAGTTDFAVDVAGWYSDG